VRAVPALARLKGRPYLFVVNPTCAADEEAAEQLIAERARATYDYFLRLARSSPYGRAIQ
jgi:hypothetical protein